MSDALFTIECPTCLARLRVRRLEAVGTIWPCPKCGSLVQITPPPGWQAPSAATSPEESVAKSPGTESPIEQVSETSDGEEILQPGKASVEATSNEATPGPRRIAEKHSEVKDGAPAQEDTRDLHEGAQQADIASETTTQAIAPQPAFRRWLWAGVIVLSAAIVAAYFLWPSSPQPPGPEETSSGPTETPQQTEQIGPPQARPLSPEQAFLHAVSHRITEALSVDLTAKVPDESVTLFETLLGMKSSQEYSAYCRQRLGLREEAVTHQLIVGSGGIPKICLFKLAADQEVHHLEQLGEEVTSIGSVVIRRPKDDVTIGFAVVSVDYVIVGDLEILQEALPTHAPPTASDSVWEEALFRAANGIEGVPVFLLVRSPQAFTRLATRWFAGLPKIADALAVLEGKALAVSVGWRFSANEIGLIVWGFCQTSEEASRLREELENLRARLLERAKLFKDDREILRRASWVAISEEEWQRSLNEITGLLERAAIQAEETTTQLEWKEAKAWEEVEPKVRAVETVWKVLATAQCYVSESLLGKAVTQSSERHGVFPRAVLGGELLPPETRLSWIAEMLPYLGYEEWHAGLHLGYSWNAPQNQLVTQRFLPEVTNPLLGATQAQPDYYDAHFAGVTGVGTQAGQLPISDARAGLFNFRERVRREDVKDGLSNTLAILPVEKKLGPWAAGGIFTARGLTQPPYVGGNDGFGSGQPNGMLAVMADGSVRFIHRDVDPRVMEQLATIAGGEAVNLDILPSPTEMPGHFDNPPLLPTIAPDKTPAAPIGRGEIPGVDPCGCKRTVLAEEAPKLSEKIQTEVAIESWPAIPAGLAIALITQWSAIPVAIDAESLQWRSDRGLGQVSIKPGLKKVKELLEELAEQIGLNILLCDDQVVLCCDERLANHAVYRLSNDVFHLPPQLFTSILSVISGEHSANLSDVKYSQQGDAFTLEGPFLPVLSLRDLLQRHPPLLAGNETTPSQNTSPQTLSLNFYEPAPIIEILAAINRSAPVQVLLDWPWLLREEIQPETPVTCSAVSEPYLAVLEKFAASIDAAVYFVSPNTVLISTKDRFKRPALRAYAIKNIVARGLTVGAIRERLVKECAPERWNERGGIGRIFFTDDSETAIIFQDPEGHAAVLDFLQRLAEGQQ